MMSITAPSEQYNERPLQTNEPEPQPPFFVTAQPSSSVNTTNTQRLDFVVSVHLAPHLICYKKIKYKSNHICLSVDRPACLTWPINVFLGGNV